MTQVVYRCGIVGFGYMGEIRARTINESDRLSLIGVLEPDSSKHGALEPSIIADDIDALLARDPDIVFVCTPNAYAPEIAVTCMAAGKHVFCEKPPGRNLQDIRDIRAAEVAGQKLMFGFNHRFHPAILKAKATVDSGRMGRILAMRGLYGKSGGMGYQSSWRNDKSISGGGILLDQGIHMLDLFRYFGGDFDQVKAFTEDSFWDVGVEDNAFVILRQNGGCHATLHSSATLWKHTFKLDINLENGYLVVEGLLSKSGSYGREHLVVGTRQFEDETSAVGNPAEEITYFDRDLSWELEVREMIRCIDENETVTVSSSLDALKVMEIIENAYRDAAVNMGESGDA